MEEGEGGVVEKGVDTTDGTLADGVVGPPPPGPDTTVVHLSSKSERAAGKQTRMQSSW